MRPPVLAEAFVAAAAPSHDCEIVAGDLHEEYVRIRSLSGAAAANRWYWAQTLLSVPSLLSYSRSDDSVLRQIGVALIALAVLATMLVAVTLIEAILQPSFSFHHHILRYTSVCTNYAGALVFGAILSRLVRTDGLRVTFRASVFLVLCFAVPAIAGNPSSQAPFSTWLQLFAVVPVMSIGAVLDQILRRRANSSN
jgi:hypothetical protein